MHSRRWKALIAAGLVGGWTSWAAAQETVLTFATLNPPNAAANAEILHAWAGLINERGKGVLRIDVRDGFALANYGNVYDRVLDDVIHIGFGLTSAIGGRFPMSEVSGLPFISDKAEAASAALWHLYAGGELKNEYKDIVPLMLVSFPQTGLHLAKAPASVDTLAGMKLTAVGRIQTQVISRLGGTPVSLPLTDVYEGLQRGTAAGVVIAWTAFQPFKLGEVTSYHVDTTLGTSPGFVFMSRKKFESLPAAARKILEENSGEDWSRKFGAFWDRQDDLERNRIKAAANHTVTTLSPHMKETWNKTIAPVIEEWVKTREGGASIHQKFVSLVGTYNTRGR